MLNTAARWVERFAFPLNRFAYGVGLAILFLMMLLTVGNVVGRRLAGWAPFFQPIPGAFELTNFMLALIVFFSIGYTLIRQGHISIDVVVSHFSPRTRAVIDCIIYFLSLGLFSLVTWQSAVYAGRLFEGHNISGVLSLPIYIFVIAAAFGSLLFCLVLLVNILSSLAKAVQHES